MDGITDPVVLVLGHPIAGNPSQFAFERALDALGLRWRVLSCDVAPDRVNAAIAGADALGFHGLLLDRNLVDGDGERRDDFYRRPESGQAAWVSEDVMRSWLEQVIRDFFQSETSPIGPLLWIGQPDPSFPSQLSPRQSQSPIAWASTESIEKADLIAISEPVDAGDWPTCGHPTLVVDLANPPNDVEQIRSLGYEVLGRKEIRVGVLMRCLGQWTGQHPSAEVLSDAVEEYLAV